MALALASAGLMVYQGVEQQRAGKAAKKQADEAAEEERRRAAAEGAMAMEEQHDILVEGQYEAGALKAIGGAAGVSGGSFSTLLGRVKAQTRRKMFLLQQRTSESMRQSYFSAEQFKSEGKRALRRGRQESYMSFGKAGMTLGWDKEGEMRDWWEFGKKKYEQPLYRSH